MNSEPLQLPLSDVAVVITEHLERIEAFDTPEAAHAWVRGVVFFVARHTVRAELVRTDAWRRLRDAFRHPGFADGRPGGLSEAATLLAVGFAAISDRDRQLLIGQVWDGLTTSELAAAHGLSETAVRQRLTRARATARQEIRRNLVSRVTNDDREGMYR